MTGRDAPRVAPRGAGGDPDDGGRPRLVLPDAARAELTRSLEAAYPREGCGLLLGGLRAPDRVVEEVRPAANRWEGRDDRYLVDPETLRRAVDDEAGGGPRVLGFYHSHPDAEPVPSATDREMAWPWYLYLIVPVRDGRADPGRAWQLAPGGEGWRERPVVEPRRTGEPAGDGGEDPAPSAEGDARPAGPDANADAPEA